MYLLLYRRSAHGSLLVNTQVYTTRFKAEERRASLMASGWPDVWIIWIDDPRK